MSTNASAPAPAPTPAPAHLLEVQDVGVAFDNPSGRVEVVRDMTFTLDRGESLGVVGESGSGKSMTALAIMQLLPEKAKASGSIRFDGQELIGRSDKDLRRLRGDRIAMVFQDPLSSLNPYYTVGNQIAETYRAHRGGSKRDAMKVAVDSMDKVHIRDAANVVDHYPHQFSGGMRQRIMIAMALVCEPDIIIADEPTTALDVTVQAQVLDLIAEIQERTGAALLFISHNLSVVAQVSSRVMVMNNGEVVEQGTAEQVFSAPQHPYTRKLLDSTPRIDDPVADLLSPEELLARMEEER